MTDLGPLVAPMPSILERADAMFERQEGQNETAINARGFDQKLLVA